MSTSFSIVRASLPLGLLLTIVVSSYFGPVMRMLGTVVSDRVTVSWGYPCRCNSKDL